MKERRHGPNQEFERAKDFKGTLKKLFKSLGAYKIPIIIVFAFAIASIVFAVAVLVLKIVLAFAKTYKEKEEEKSELVEKIKSLPEERVE